MACVGGDALNQTRKLKISLHDHHLDCGFGSLASKISFGSGAMLSFGGVGGGNGTAKSGFRSFDHEESGDEYLDEYFNQPEKKRRLSMDQVQFLERSFEEENKLEPERKIQLAKELGLQPRQIAVWFQNRRARWKTRQLETDYETLNANYKSLKADYDTLLGENEKLKAEVLRLKHKGLVKDPEKGNFESCEAEEYSRAIPREALADVITETGESVELPKAIKKRERSSAKCNDTYVDASIDGTQSSTLEACDSSRSLSEDDLSAQLLQTDYSFPTKIEDAYCHPSAASFSYGFPIEDQAFSFWSY